MREVFDNWLNSLINFGRDKEAVANIKEHAIYMLLMGASVCSDRLKDNVEALALTKAAIELSPNDPRLNSNLALIYLKLDKPDLALEFSNKAIVNGNFIECYINHGLVLEKMTNYEGAKKCFKKALEFSPNNAALHRKLDFLCYQLKQYSEFLFEGQWNNRMLNGKSFVSRFHTIWDGKADLTHKKVLVFNEHGFGDILNYCRTIEYIKKDDVHIILEVDDPQVSLFKYLATVDEVVGREDLTYAKEPRVNYDYAVSAACLFYYFDPNLEKISPEPYLLVPPNQENPGVKIVNSTNKVKVGIIWAGNHFHNNDYNRSCYLKYFEPFCNIENVQLFGLQKGRMQRSYPLSGESWFEGGDLRMVDLMEGGENVKYIDLADHLNDFKDTAEILKSLDLLITVDSSIGHLAGAIGVPTWVLIPKIYDWRWEYQWYKNHKVFMQQELGEWENLFLKVAEELKDVANKGAVLSCCY